MPGPAVVVGDATLDTRLRLRRPLDLAQTLGPVRRGRGDPCLHVAGHDAVRATRTPEGPATTWLRHGGAELEVRAWGPGARWAADHVADLVGEHDDVDGFTALLATVDRPEQPLLHDLHRRHPGVRIPRSAAVTEAMFPTILEQRVTSASALRSYRSLVRALGAPAPGPPEVARHVVLPPAPDRLARLPVWTYHRHEVERGRADTIRRVAARAPALDAAADLPLEAAYRRLRSVPGVGAWTLGGVGLCALGDPDAVIVGDDHVPHQVSWLFRGVARSTDAQMLALLAPYQGHRGRVLRLLGLSGVGPPRFGPRRVNPRISRL